MQETFSRISGNKFSGIASIVKNNTVKPKTFISLEKAFKELTSFRSTVNLFFLKTFLQFIFFHYGEFIDIPAALFPDAHKTPSVSINKFVSSNIAWVLEYFPSISYFKRTYAGFHYVRYIESLFGIDKDLRLYIISKEAIKSYNVTSRLFRKCEKKHGVSFVINERTKKPNVDGDLGIDIVHDHSNSKLSVVSNFLPVVIPGFKQEQRVLASAIEAPSMLKSVRNLFKREQNMIQIGRVMEVESGTALMMGFGYENIEAYDEDFELDQEQDLLFSGRSEGKMIRLFQMTEVNALDLSEAKIGSDPFSGNYCYLELFHRQNREKIRALYPSLISLRELALLVWNNSFNFDYGSTISIEIEPSLNLIHVTKGGSVPVHVFVKNLLCDYLMKDRIDFTTDQALEIVTYLSNEIYEFHKWNSHGVCCIE